MTPIEEGDPVLLLIIMAVTLLFGGWVQQWLNPEQPSINGIEPYIRR
jgi:hypothetical protein